MSGFRSSKMLRLDRNSITLLTDAVVQEFVVQRKTHSPVKECFQHESKWCKENKVRVRDLRAAIVDYWEWEDDELRKPVPDPENGPDPDDCEPRMTFADYREYKAQERRSREWEKKGRCKECGGDPSLGAAGICHVCLEGIQLEEARQRHLQETKEKIAKELIALDDPRRLGN